MQTVIFDGYRLAKEREEALKKRVVSLKAKGQRVKIVAIFFEEDTGSVLYSSLKQEAAKRLGIDYELRSFSLENPQSASHIIGLLHQLAENSKITGVIIQKPWKKTWIEATGGSKRDFSMWWQSLVSQIPLEKDVDGLHPETIKAVQNNTWKQQKRVLPATCRAVLSILDKAGISSSNVQDEQKNTQEIIEKKKIVILGKSDLLGIPLTHILKNLGYIVENIGSKELSDRIEQKKYLFDADVVVSATGRHHLITGEYLSEGVVLIDVGEPQPDIDFQSSKHKASFITPVPGGVGPMTVVSLMENGVELVETVEKDSSDF